MKRLGWSKVSISAVLNRLIKALKISDHYPVEVELRNKGLKRMCVPQAPKQNVPSRPARKKGPQKKNNVKGKQRNEQNVPPKRKRVRSSQASHTPAKRGRSKND